ncbi:mechanosensitive ion channel protein 6-like [Euphorbia lathyris]|uniref:mechanosensitive ion channel protein 6-like n=1 Tax=Euphorbia lathyris TaxID=212925 RepID=UPI003313C437
MEYSQLKKSFKNNASYNMRRISGSGGPASDSNEELPILSHHRLDNAQDSGSGSGSSPAAIKTDRNEVVVKVDAATPANPCSDNITEVSSNIGTPRNQDTEDPPSKLIGQFLKKQKMVGGEISLDMDMEMDELRRDFHDLGLPPLPESSLRSSNTSKEIRVSFDPYSSGMDGSIESIRRRYRDLQEGKENSVHNTDQQLKRDQVLKCTSNSSFRADPNSNISRLKTKSRILDPSPEELDRMSERLLPPKSSPLKSTGGVGLSRATDEEEEDPLEGEDLPQEYTISNINTWTVLQWLGLIGIIAALICTLVISSLREQDFLQLKLWKWEVLLLVLISGRLVSGWGIRIIVFFIERNFLLRKRVLYFVYGLKSGVQNCWWLGLVLLAWHFLFDGKVRKDDRAHILKYVTRVLVCFLVANFIWLIKTLMVKVLASSFHVSTYFDRIQESIFNQYVIETLSGPPLVEIQKNDEDEFDKTSAEIRRLQNAGIAIPAELKQAVLNGGNTNVQRSLRAGKSFRFSKQLSKKGDNKKGDTGITIENLHKLNHKNISAWNMKRLMNIVRHGSLSTLDEQILGHGHYDEYGTEIRSEQEAKAAARKIYHNVARHGSRYIYLEDLLRFMREDEALKTMSCFEGASETKRISKSSLKDWVVNAFRERRALALTLNDTKTAVNRLHKVVKIVVSVIIMVIWLVILGIATSKFVLFIGSQFLVVSFIFGNTAKTLFESIIFLFLIHPFDVGDRCEVDGEQYIVEEMNILTTVFLRGDNLKVVFPNSVLAMKPIGNFYRSPDMGDAVDFYIHISTPAEKISAMKQRIISFIEGKKEHWYPGPAVVLMELASLKKIKVAVWIRHRNNHQDMGERYIRRSLLIEEVVRVLKELDLHYMLFPRDFNINDNTPPP